MVVDAFKQCMTQTVAAFLWNVSENAVKLFLKQRLG